MSDDARFKILTDFMMKSMEEEDEQGNIVETDRASADNTRLKGRGKADTLVSKVGGKQTTLDSTVGESRQPSTQR
jgi:hypothetical protein